MSGSRIDVLATLFREFSAERAKYRAPDIRDIIDRLERAAETALYAENESGGHARQVVADVATVLGVVLNDVGPGRFIWDPENMVRVVAAAEQVKSDRDRWQREAERLKAQEDERRKARLRPVIWHTTTAEEHTWKLDDDDPLNVKRVAELKAVIVSQAREIARLKGESE
ncbi:hypothetical protein AB0K92_16100 [Streptomyces sp. NPDC052687]|uniref:hypothetical protein n=1 Tax=Streptomyces sp. NPDC052687 TaxID=3154759 RepID=UPI0034349FE0